MDSAVFYTIKVPWPLYFGRGSFTAGEHHEASFHYELPTPETLYGAVRSALAAQTGKLEGLIRGEYDPVLGSDSALGSLRLAGPVVVSANQKLVLPLPPFAYGKRKDKESKEFKLPELVEAETDLGRRKVPLYPEDAEALKERWLTLRDLEALFGGQSIVVKPEDKPPFVASYKLGIKLEHGTADEGFLYVRQGTEMVGEYSLGFWMWGLEKPPDTINLRLGGDGTPAVAQRTDPPGIPEPEEAEEYWLYVVTPAIFQDPLCPPVEGEVVFPGVGRPLPITGWDMAKGEPKDLRLAVPPGSAYLIRGDLRDYHKKLVGERNQKGFGLVFVFPAKSKGG